MLPGLGGGSGGVRQGDRYVIKKAKKSEHLQARASAGLSDENKLQDKGYGIGA